MAEIRLKRLLYDVYLVAKAVLAIQNVAIFIPWNLHLEKIDSFINWKLNISGILLDIMKAFPQQSFYCWYFLITSK